MLLVGALIVGVGIVWRQAGGGIVRAWIHPMLERPRLSFFAAYPVSAENIVMLGDSITAGGEWAEMLPGARALNRGIGADRTDDVLGRLAAITAARPRKLFLLIGTNDLGTGVAEERIVANYEQILDRLAHESPGTTVYVQSVLPRKARFRAKIEALNRRIEQLAVQRALVFVDLYPSFVSPDGGIRAEFTYDDLHLSGDGYRKWQELISSHVRA